MAKSSKCLVVEHSGPEPYFRIEDKQPQKLAAGGQFNLRARKPQRIVDDLSRRTHDSVSIGDELNSVYPHAIEIGNVERGRSIGIILSIGLLVMAVLVGSILVMSYRMLSSSPSFSAPYVILTIFSIFILLMFLAVMWGLSAALRQVSMGPHDAPILFNRKTREVTIFRLGDYPILKFWAQRKTWVTKCPWDQIKVRTYGQLSQSGGVAPTSNHVLYLLWGDPDDPRRLMGCAQLGSRGGYRDDDLFKKWEFVRRYMEEDGPSIPPGGHLGPGYDKPILFSTDVIEAAGGQPYSREEVEALARRYTTTQGTDGEVQRSA